MASQGSRSATLVFHFVLLLALPLSFGQDSDIEDDSDSLSLLALPPYISPTAGAEKSEDSSVHMRSISLQKQYVPVNNNGKIAAYKTAYFGEIKAGNPAQAFPVVFDTGLTPHKSLSHESAKLSIRGSSAVSSAAQLSQRQKVDQPSDVTVSTTHENFFQRMGNAIMAMVVGTIMIYLSLPVLWLNEKRNAKYEALIDRGEGECRSVAADKPDEKNMNWPVHVTGTTSSTEPVKDKQFNVRYDSGVIRISSLVEFFQHKEEERSKSTSTETLGGGKTTSTVKWKEYSKMWRDTYDSGASFDKPEYRNSKPKGIEAGSNSCTNERVELGKGFLLGNTELVQLCGGTPATIDKLKCHQNPELDFKFDANSGFYYCGKGSLEAPQIGDVRVRFTVLKDGPATVVGLQVQSDEEGRAGFLPYRVIRRSLFPCFRLSEEEEKEKLGKEANKDTDEINDEEMWSGMLWCCCCASNLVQSCYNKTAMPEILDVFGTSLSKAEAFQRIRGKASMTKWIFRLLGWLLMFCGLYLTFSPFTTFLKILPFGIGSFLSSVGSTIVFLFSFMVTLLVSSIIVAVAYSMYHPIVGVVAFAFVAAVVTGIGALCNLAHG